MQTIRVAILVSMFSISSSIALAQTRVDRAGQCTCNGFPGNYPGVGLYKYPENNSSRQAALLRLFPATQMTDRDLGAALQACKDLYKVKNQHGACKGELLFNGEA